MSTATKEPTQETSANDWQTWCEGAAEKWNSRREIGPLPPTGAEPDQLLTVGGKPFLTISQLARIAGEQLDKAALIRLAHAK